MKYSLFSFLLFLKAKIDMKNCRFFDQYTEFVQSYPPKKYTDILILILSRLNF